MFKKEESSRGDIVYYIDEEKRTVVAKYYPTDLSELLNLKGIYNLIVGDILTPNDVVVKNCYEGKAKCSTEDTFDAKRGKDIARIRAITSYKLDVATKIGHIQSVLFEIRHALFQENEKLKQQITNLSTKLIDAIGASDGGRETLIDGNAEEHK